MDLGTAYHTCISAYQKRFQKAYVSCMYQEWCVSGYEWSLEGGCSKTPVGEGVPRHSPGSCRLAFPWVPPPKSWLASGRRFWVRTCDRGGTRLGVATALMPGPPHRCDRYGTPMWALARSHRSREGHQRLVRPARPPLSVVLGLRPRRESEMGPADRDLRASDHSPQPTSRTREAVGADATVIEASPVSLAVSDPPGVAPDGSSG